MEDRDGMLVCLACGMVIANDVETSNQPRFISGVNWRVAAPRLAALAVAVVALGAGLITATSYALKYFRAQQTQTDRVSTLQRVDVREDLQRIGSPLPDELVALASDEAGLLHMLVRLHDVVDGRKDTAEWVQFDPAAGTVSSVGWQGAPPSTGQMRAPKESHVSALADATGEWFARAHDARGAVIWEHAFAYDRAVEVRPQLVQTEAGWLAMGPPPVDRPFEIVHIDAEGDKATRHPIKFDRAPLQMLLLPAASGGSMVIAALPDRLDLGTEQWLVRLSETGEELSRQSLGVSGKGDIVAAVPDTEGGVYLLERSPDAALARFDASGKRLWQTDLPVPATRGGLTLTLSPDGRAIVTATVTTAADSDEIWFGLFREDGFIDEVERIDPEGSARVSHVLADASGQVWLAGWTQADAYSPADVFLIRRTVAGARETALADTARASPAVMSLQPAVASEAVAPALQPVAPSQAEEAQAYESAPSDTAAAAVSGFVTAGAEMPVQPASATGTSLSCRFVCRDPSQPDLAYPVSRTIDAFTGRSPEAIAREHIAACAQLGNLIADAAEAACTPQ